MRAIFALHEAGGTSASTKEQLDAVINHLIGIQVLHAHFIEQDMPALAQRRADELGWAAR